VVTPVASRWRPNAGTACVRGHEVGPSELDVEHCAPRNRICDPPRRQRRLRHRQSPWSRGDGESAGEPVIISLDPSAWRASSIDHDDRGDGRAEDDAMELLEALRRGARRPGAARHRSVRTRHPGFASGHVAGLSRPSPAVAGFRSRFVARAAGTLLGREGDPASPIDWETVATMDPQMLLMAPVGMHLPAAKRALRDPTAGVLARHGGGSPRSKIFYRRNRSTSSDRARGSSTALECWPRSSIPTDSSTPRLRAAGRQ